MPLLELQAEEPFESVAIGNVNTDTPPPMFEASVEAVGVEFALESDELLELAVVPPVEFDRGALGAHTDSEMPPENPPSVLASNELGAPPIMACVEESESSDALAVPIPPEKSIPTPLRAPRVLLKEGQAKDALRPVEFEAELQLPKNVAPDAATVMAAAKNRYPDKLDNLFTTPPVLRSIPKNQGGSKVALPPLTARPFASGRCSGSASLPAKQPERNRQ